MRPRVDSESTGAPRANRDGLRYNAIDESVSGGLMRRFLLLTPLLGAIACNGGDAPQGLNGAANYAVSLYVTEALVFRAEKY